MMTDRKGAFEVIASILSQTADPWVLENLGAGPLEDLLHEGDEETIGIVGGLAEKYPSTIEALKSVWMNDFPQNVKNSIEQIISARRMG
jgi:hypothetical protein